MSSLQALKDLNDLFINELKSNDEQLERAHKPMRGFSKISRGSGANTNHSDQNIFDLTQKNIDIIRYMKMYSKVKSNICAISIYSYTKLEFYQSEITDEICAESHQERIKTESQLIKDRLSVGIDDINQNTVLLPESKSLLQKLKDALK